MGLNLVSQWDRMIFSGDRFDVFFFSILEFLSENFQVALMQ